MHASVKNQYFKKQLWLPFCRRPYAVSRHSSCRCPQSQPPLKRPSPAIKTVITHLHSCLCRSSSLPNIAAVVAQRRSCHHLLLQPPSKWPSPTMTAAFARHRPALQLLLPAVAPPSQQRLLPAVACCRLPLQLPSPAITAAIASTHNDGCQPTHWLLLGGPAKNFEINKFHRNTFLMS